MASRFARRSVSLSARRWGILAARRFIALLVLVVALAVPLFAEDDTLSFVLAPPPVGYPVFSKGDKTTQAGGNAILLSVKQGGERILVGGGSGFGHWQSTVTDSLSIGLNAGGTLLAGSKNELFIIQTPLQANAVVVALKRPSLSVFLFGGIGADIGLSTMIVDVPQVIDMIMKVDPTRFNTTTVMSSGSIGAQFNVSLGDFIASPFGSWTYTAGTYSYTQTSAMSFDYPSGSGTIAESSSTTLGFDLLYRPWDISLSSMLRRTDSYTLVTVALKRLLGRVVD